MSFEQTIGDLPDRVTVGNQKPVASGGQYVLVVLNRALRGQDNAVIDGAISHANHLSLPIVVYSELDEGVAWASDRLFYFALGAFKELAIILQNRNILCIQHIKSADDQQLASLASNAAAIYTDEDYTYWDRAKLQSLLEAARQTVFLVDASRLVPTRLLF